MALIGGGREQRMFDEAPLPDELGDPLELMEWNEIHEPGSYLHLASGLIARVEAEDLSRAPAAPRALAGLVVRLLPNARAPLGVLREIARRHGYHVNA